IVDGAAPAEDPVPVRLKEAALRLFASRGLERVTIREIADAARVNSALLYHYFENKEQLYEQILTERVNTLTDRLSEANSLDLPPMARLEALSYAFLSHFRDEGTGGAFTMRELLGLG